MSDPTIVDDIVQNVLEKGSLNKEEVVATWGIGGDEEYHELQRAVLKRAKGEVEKGPQGAGGFVAKARKGPLPDEAESDAFDWEDEWERQTVARLAELLKHATLEELLGDLTKVMRQARKQAGGSDRRGTKSELATALLLNHGIDLFCNTKIRKAVGKAAKVPAPDAWHPGKAKAIRFVGAAGFPAILAGLPTGPRNLDYETLEGRFSIHPLEPFQQEVQRGLLETLHTPGDRAIVTLPTGGGKTRVAVESIKDWLFTRYDTTGRRAAEPSVVLWLAHTEELCEQAYACFKQVWEGSENVCPLLLFRFWGHYTQDLAKHKSKLEETRLVPSVLISTPQRMINLLNGQVEDGQTLVSRLRETLGLLMVDEAHRAAAPSYRRIVSDLLPAGRPIAVAGLTATPFRNAGEGEQEGAKQLKQIFKKLVEPFETLGVEPRVKLQEMGILARPESKTIKTTTALPMPSKKDVEDASDDELEEIDRKLRLRADNPQRRMAVLAELEPLAKDKDNLILYFGPTVRDAEAMAYLLRRAKITAAVVSGSTRDVTRRQVVNEFKKGNIRVLCNCEVLTTGFDAPRVTHVVMARPTVSRVLYEQIVGRGLRGPKFGGTERCVILDCEDDYRGERPQLGYERFRQVWASKPVAK